MGRTACTEPQCLYTGALYLTLPLFQVYNYTSLIYLVITKLTFDNHLPDESQCRPKHIAGFPHICKLLSFHCWSVWCINTLQHLFSVDDISASELNKTRRHPSARASELQMVLSLQFSDLAICCLHLQGRRSSLLYNFAIYIPNSKASPPWQFKLVRIGSLETTVC